MDSGKDFTEYLICSTLESLNEIVPNFAENGDSALAICNKGMLISLFYLCNNYSISAAVIMDILDKAKSNLGSYDVRIIYGKNLITSLENFQEEAGQFDAGLNKSRCKSEVRLVVKNVQKIKDLISKPWNTNLQKLNEPVSDNPADGEGPVVSGDWVFYKASPLKQERPTFICDESGCGETYRNANYFMKHMKTKHNRVTTVDVPKTTCRLEHKRGTRAKKEHPMDQITTHLRQVCIQNFISKRNLNTNTIYNFTN